MVNARLCETARQGFFFASSRHLDFLDCETKTSYQRALSVRPLALQKIETLRHLRIKKRNFETHITAEKRDCETCKIRLKFWGTQSF